MADFYQVPLPDDIPKTSKDYLRWEKLNFALRQIYNMIDNVDGRQGPITFKSTLSMKGNPISNGPVQTSAQETDFIDKSYFRTSEFGHLCVNLLVSGGKTPLPITGLTGVPAVGGGTISTVFPLAGGGTLPATVSIVQASGTQSGYLSSGDWTIFNNKQNTIPSGHVVQPFIGQTSVTVTHNFGAYPIVQAIDGGGNVLVPQLIQHTSVNSVTVTFLAPTSGNIICAKGK